MRAFDAGLRVGRLEEVVQRYRVHDANDSANQERLLREALTIYRASVARKRGER